MLPLVVSRDLEDLNSKLAGVGRRGTVLSTDPLRAGRKEAQHRREPL
jgi:hypothetical protein